ncbi:hypothetical protein Poli38472_004108 [Pythium oligandrum]|uniref:Transmembrane protein n=1 Tax=Pythium oligandrum TaxID=41045 RepID=A0A8K1FQ81_PYTOL|nr:hypothetical protein Poli38472_004108 [Pythium oligandrum]|eukprot:TMW66343.1 hypothetical protein Poli38472_004108 [Pythium oligandrum]
MGRRASVGTRRVWRGYAAFWACMTMLAAFSMCDLVGVVEAQPVLRSERVEAAAIFDPLLSASVVKNLLQEQNASNKESLPPVDRVFEFPQDFRPDAPFTVQIRPGEAILVPLDPVHEQLFPTEESSSSNFALGLELNACRGKVLTYIILKNDKHRKFSSADYQCMTISHVAKDQQDSVNLCPWYHPDRPITMYVEPSDVKGFLLHASVGEDVDAIVLLRSTKSSGGYKRAFEISDPSITSGADDVQIDLASAERIFNVSFSYDDTVVSFDAPNTWSPQTTTGSQAGIQLEESVVCEDCEYVLYAALEDSKRQHMPWTQFSPPYCVDRDATVKHVMPPKSSVVKHQQIQLDDEFADKFRQSGDYHFLLMASLPKNANNGHAAFLPYSPQQVRVIAPTHYTSHFILAFTLLGVVACIIVAAVKYEVPERAVAWWKSRDATTDTPDDESIRLLAQAIVAHSDAEADDEQVEEESTGNTGEATLLDAIRRSKAQDQPVPPPAVQQLQHLEGYHDIE